MSLSDAQEETSGRVMPSEITTPSQAMNPHPGHVNAQPGPMRKRSGRT